MSEPKLRARKYAFLLVGIVLALLLLPSGYLLFRYSSRPPLDFFPNGESVWKWHFIKHRLVYRRFFRLHTTHATRGWTPNPNQCFPYNFLLGFPHVSTNNKGHRSLKDYRFEATKYRILVLGDSFTFGWEALDSEVWPTLLQRSDDRLQVVNLGVAGYGLDQMYITLRETIEEYQPHLVILAFINDDLLRTPLSFYFYAKPKFTISGDGTLALTNTPICAPQELRERMIREYPQDRLWEKLYQEDLDYSTWFNSEAGRGDRYRLNSRILEETMQCAQRHAADFLLAYLSYGDYIDRKKQAVLSSDYGEDFLDDFEASHRVAVLETREAFLKAGGPWTNEHYKGPEATLLAKLVYETLAAVPSWKSYLKRQDKTGTSGH